MAYTSHYAKIIKIILKMIVTPFEAQYFSWLLFRCLLQNVFLVKLCRITWLHIVTAPFPRGVSYSSLICCFQSIHCHLVQYMFYHCVSLLIISQTLVNLSEIRKKYWWFINCLYVFFITAILTPTLLSYPLLV